MDEPPAKRPRRNDTDYATSPRAAHDDHPADRRNGHDINSNSNGNSNRSKRDEPRDRKRRRSRSRSRSPFRDSKRRERSRDRDRDRDRGYRERDGRSRRDRSRDRAHRSRKHSQSRSRSPLPSQHQQGKPASTAPPPAPTPPSGPSLSSRHHQTTKHIHDRSSKPEGPSVNGGPKPRNALPLLDPDAMQADDSADDEEAQIRRVMGFAGFRSTKNTKVPGNQIYVVRKEKKTTYRQYMNRVGGFNRPLSPSR